MKWTGIYLYLFLSALIIAAANIVFGSENEIQIVTIALSSFALAFILSVVLGIFMTDKIEVYFLNYRNKYFPSRIN